MTFNHDDIDRYLHDKAVNNITNSNHTTRAYRTKLRQFLEFGGGSTGADVAKLYRDRLSETRASDQVKACLYVLSNFFQFLDVEPNAFYDLSRAYRMSKKEITIKKKARDERVLSDLDIQKILDHAGKARQGLAGVEYYIAHRNLFMLQMLSKYGMRIEALVMMNIEHIDQSKRRAQIMSSKNQVPYPIPIIDMLDTIRGYLNIRSRYMGSTCVDLQALILSRGGRRLSDTSARRAINSIFENVGVYEPQRSTHQLRHYRATRYHRNGMTQHLIASIMGMSEQTLRTTYLHLTDDDTVGEYEAWSRNRSHQGPPHACPRCGYSEDINGGHADEGAMGASRLSIVRANGGGGL